MRISPTTHATQDVVSLVPFSPHTIDFYQQGRTLMFTIKLDIHVLDSEVEAFVGDVEARGRITYIGQGQYVVWLERVEDGLWPWETAMWSPEAVDPQPSEILVRAIKAEHDPGDPVLPACEIQLNWRE